MHGLCFLPRIAICLKKVQHREHGLTFRQKVDLTLLYLSADFESFTFGTALRAYTLFVDMSVTS